MGPTGAQPLLQSNEDRTGGELVSSVRPIRSQLTLNGVDEVWRFLGCCIITTYNVYNKKQNTSSSQNPDIFIMQYQTPGIGDMIQYFLWTGIPLNPLNRIWNANKPNMRVKTFHLSQYLKRIHFVLVSQAASCRQWAARGRGGRAAVRPPTGSGPKSGRALPHLPGRGQKEEPETWEPLNPFLPRGLVLHFIGRINWQIFIGKSWPRYSSYVECYRATNWWCRRYSPWHMKCISRGNETIYALFYPQSLRPSSIHASLFVWKNPTSVIFILVHIILHIIHYLPLVLWRYSPFTLGLFLAKTLKRPSDKEVKGPVCLCRFDCWLVSYS